MSLERRITAILNSRKPGAALQVRTSPAFAARFAAEANRSGLTVDLEEKDTGQMVRVCSVCGAQNSPSSRRASTASLTSTPASPRRHRSPSARSSPEARWLLIFATPPASKLPLLEVPLNRAPHKGASSFDRNATPGSADD